MSNRKFTSWKKWSAFAAVGAVAGAGLYGVQAQDYRAALSLVECAPRVERERQTFQSYMNSIQRIGENEAQEQVRALREALRYFNAATRHAVSEVVRASQSGLSSQERNRILAPVSQEISRLDQQFRAAKRTQGLADYGFDGVQCPHEFLANAQQVDRPVTDASGAVIRLDSASIGVRLFDDSTAYRCNLPFSNVHFPDRLRELRLVVNANEAKAIACTFRNAGVGRGLVEHVRTCSSVNLLEPWGPNNSLAIEGDTAETALYHPEAIRQIDRDYENGHVAYRLPESAWLHANLSEDERFVRRGCMAVVEEPEFTLRGAPAAQSTSVRGGDVSELIDPWADEARDGDSSGDTETVVDDDKLILPNLALPEQR
jgi:hypothetical protein